jgi:hypothetical protein
MEKPILPNILEKMPKKIKPSVPRVHYPVNPEEDFADRWGMKEYSDLKLEENFNIWIQQAKLDFQTITKANDPIMLNESFNKKFAVNVGQENLKKKLGFRDRTGYKPKEHTIQEPVRPWKR